jgi:FkbM family methyltransferase
MNFGLLIGPTSGELYMKALLRSAFRSIGYEVSRTRPGRQDFLKSRSIDTIIDVGANDGKFAREVRDRGYTGSIVSFEPIREVYRRLADRFANDRRWKGYNLGVSNKSGEAVIGVSEATVFSSLHKLKVAASRLEERSNVVRYETIKITTLGECSDKIKGNRLFLKLDTQGHEQACLEGLGELKNRVEGIQMELPLSALYENVWSFHEAVYFMKQLDFVPCIFSPVSYHKCDPVAVVEVDCTFRRYNTDYD